MEKLVPMHSVTIQLHIQSVSFATSLNNGRESTAHHTNNQHKDNKLTSKTRCNCLQTWLQEECLCVCPENIPNYKLNGSKLFFFSPTVAEV